MTLLRASTMRAVSFLTRSAVALLSQTFDRETRPFHSPGASRRRFPSFATITTYSQDAGSSERGKQARDAGHGLLACYRGHHLDKSASEDERRDQRQGLLRRVHKAKQKASLKGTTPGET